MNRKFLLHLLIFGFLMTGIACDGHSDEHHEDEDDGVTVEAEETEGGRI